MHGWNNWKSDNITNSRSARSSSSDWFTWAAPIEIPILVVWKWFTDCLREPGPDLWPHTHTHKHTQACNESCHECLWLDVFNQLLMIFTLNPDPGRPLWLRASVSEMIRDVKCSLTPSLCCVCVCVCPSVSTDLTALHQHVCWHGTSSC